MDARYLRQIIRVLLEELLALEQAELTVILVDAPEMTHLNETFLQHAGSTDVITFDYSEPGTRNSELIHGDVFVCVAEAVRQARRFRTTWFAEVVRYIVHGVLHLRGYDDLRAAPRRVMKREETRGIKTLAQRFVLSSR